MFSTFVESKNFYQLMQSPSQITRDDQIKKKVRFPFSRPDKIIWALKEKKSNSFLCTRFILESL